MNDLDRIINRCSCGDEEAFTMLFNNYKNLVYKTAILMVGNSLEAEDILQDVFIRVYKGLPGYKPQKAAFSTWLYRITINTCLNRRRKKIPVEFSRETQNRPLGSNQSQEMDSHLENKMLLQTGLSSLSPKVKSAVILRYYWELSYEEIAEVMRIPVGTVRSRLHNAITNLHKQITCQGDENVHPLNESESI